MFCTCRLNIRGDERIIIAPQHRRNKIQAFQEIIAKKQAVEAAAKEVDAELAQATALWRQTHIAEVKHLMLTYGIKVSHLKNVSNKPTKNAAVKFKGPNGEQWSGRGREPLWIKGKDREQFKA